MVPALAVALALWLTTESALGQLTLKTSRALQVTPPGSASLGQAVTLSVQGAARGARYSYVAVRTATGAAVRGTAPVCSTNQSISIGSGSSVTWHPASGGTYRLTAYGTGQAADTFSLTYIVKPRAVMLASSQTPAQPSGVTLVLRTDDLGPGHVYQWWMQYRGQPVATGGGTAQPGPLSQPWTTQTNGPMATYPTPIPPPSSIAATVSIHRGDPCQVIAAGTMP